MNVNVITLYAVFDLRWLSSQIGEKRVLGTYRPCDPYRRLTLRSTLVSMKLSLKNC